MYNFTQENCQLVLYIWDFAQALAMDRSHMNRKFVLILSLSIIGAMIMSSSVIYSHHSIFAASDFTIEAKINLQKLSDPAKMKVVASANGDTQVKNITG